MLVKFRNSWLALSRTWRTPVFGTHHRANRRAVNGWRGAQPLRDRLLATDARAAWGVAPASNVFSSDPSFDVEATATCGETLVAKLLFSVHCRLWRTQLGNHPTASTSAGNHGLMDLVLALLAQLPNRT